MALAKLQLDTPYTGKINNWGNIPTLRKCT